MKEFSVHILSLDAGNIYINGNFVGLIDNIDTFSIDISVFSNNIIITKEPISKQKKLLLPYTVKLNIKSNQISSDSDYVNVVPYKNNEYEVILQPCDIKSHKSLEKIYDDFVDNYNVVVVNDGQSYINIYQMNVLKFSIILPEIKNIVTEKHNSYILIKGINQQSKLHYLLLDESNNFNIVVNSELEKIEEYENGFKALKKINDIAKHASVLVIDYNNPSNNEEYYVYLKDNAVTTDSNKLIPFAFLEALKIQNFKLAKDYLSDDLKDSTSSSHLSEYFGNIDSIYYNVYDSSDNIINYTIFTDEYKSFDFIIKNKKISEIIDISFS